MNSNIFTLEEKQVLIYGAPGTGKSYQLNRTISEHGIDTKRVVRVVFHKDFSYSDFVGYVSPQCSNSENINYDFKAGAFSKALRLAFENEEPVCLVIEELNRGNAAAVFGDIFQLLDRDPDGKSSYSIINRDVRAFIDKSADAAKAIESYNIGENDIILPSNFYVIATMNTADQNVFTVDSAFKRRFIMRYMPLIFNESESHLAYLNRLSKLNVFDGKHTWSEFAKMVNCIIDEINYEIISISEDKKIGPYFVDEIDISCKQSFCDKVILYLKNDVFKYCDNVLNLAYEDIYREYVENGVDVFSFFKEPEEE